MRVTALVAFCSAVIYYSSSAMADIAVSTRIAAVKATARQSSACKYIGDFYWEIGDKTKVLGKGAVGFSYNANSTFQLASASKLPFATYVLERVKTPSLDQIQKMQMSAGYTAFDPITCMASLTVAGCFYIPPNNFKNEPEVGYFNYSDGHDNKLALDLGLGNYTAYQLTKELQTKLGSDNTFIYLFPDVVGGMQSTAGGYGKFLRKLLSGNFIMLNYLGSFPVCTQEGTCSTSTRSPIEKAWHYSLNHWVEDDPEGDGAFSSVGLYGFYPWITADKQYYGILAMQGIPGLAGPSSRNCGANLRKAWQTGLSVK